jgi:hypothetical protein
MKTTSLLIALSGLLLILTLSCGPLDRYPTGYEEAGFNQEVYTAYVYAESGIQDTWSPVYINTGHSRKICVGSWGGYHIRSLLRFELGDVPKQINVRNITTCELRLYMQHQYGYFNDNIYNQGEVTVEAHRMYHGWAETRATWLTSNGENFWEGGSFGPAVGSVIVGDANDRGKWISIDITPLVLDWIAAPSDNRGLILTAHDELTSQAIKEFASLNTWDKTRVPRIVINYTSGDLGLHKKRLEVGVEKDTTIGYYADDPLWSYKPGHDNFLCVGAFDGYARRTYLKFNLSEEATGIPSTANVVWAQLRLWYWPEGRSEGHRLRINRLLWDWSEDDNIGELRQLKLDNQITVNTRQIWKRPPGYQNFVINGMVQKWIDGTNPNYGMVIRNSDELKEEGFAYFASREYSDADKRPLLTIKYTLPPGQETPGSKPAQLTSSTKRLAIRTLNATSTGDEEQ